LIELREINRDSRLKTVEPSKKKRENRGKTEENSKKIEKTEEKQ